MGEEEKKEVKKGLLVLLFIFSIIATFICMTCSYINVDEYFNVPSKRDSTSTFIGSHIVDHKK